MHVVHGLAELKIHAKTTLVVRRERDGLRRYAHVGTGNYHAVTARLYEDIGIFTADEEITADVADLFNYLTGFARPQRFRKLLVAPFNLRERLVEEIRAVARAAGDGERGADPAEAQLGRGRGDRRRALPGLRRGCRDRCARSRDLHAPARGQGAEREHPRAQRARSVPRAQPALSSSRPATRRAASSAAPT